MTDGDRLRVCGVALRRLARLDVGPDPYRGAYSGTTRIREQAIVGVAQKALLECWPDMDPLPEPMDAS